MTSAKIFALECSAQGTTILHIPAAFTSRFEQKIGLPSAQSELKVITKSNENAFKFDKIKQEVDVIPVYSQGFFQDKFNYYLMSMTQTFGKDAERLTWMSLGAGEFSVNLGQDVTTIFRGSKSLTRLTTIKEFGVANAKRVFKASQLKKEIVASANIHLQANSVSNAETTNLTKFIHDISNEDGKDFLTRTGKLISIGTALLYDPVGIKNFLNLVSLYTLEEKFTVDVLDDQRDTLLASYYTNQRNVSSIAESIKAKLNNNEKVIINSHGEGGQLASRALAQIEQTGNVVEKERLKKFVSVLSTSPTTTEFHSKYIHMKHNYDNKSFGGSNVMPNYVLNKESIGSIAFSLDFSNLKQPSDRGNAANNFLKYYLSSSIKGIKNSEGAIEQEMRKNFVNELTRTAELLESNCTDFDLLAIQAFDIKKIVSTNLNTEITGYLKEGFKDGGLFPPMGLLKFKVSGNYYEGDYAELIRTDTNEYLDPDEFSLILNEGGDYTIPLKLIRYDNSFKQIGSPVQKELKIHLSQRAKVTPVYAECAVEYNNENGYYDLDGAIRGFAFEIKDGGLIKKSFYDVYGELNPSGPGLLNEKLFPDLQWVYFGAFYQNELLSKSYRIIIEDSGGVVFDKELQNPCPVNGIVPSSGLIPISP